jgi:large subunit ribosomal protein L1
VPPNIDMKMVYNKLQKTVRLQTKNEQAIKCSVGTENMKDEQIQENAFAVYNTVLSGLPKDIENISNVIIKLTMGSPVVISEESKEEKIAIKAKKREVKNA